MLNYMVTYVYKYIDHETSGNMLNKLNNEKSNSCKIFFYREE